MKRALITLAAIPLLLAGCASTFLISKDCKTNFFGKNDRDLNAMLCDQGDLRRVLASAALPRETADRLFRARCVDHSERQVGEIYKSLDRGRQRELKYAFRLNGYEVNYKPAPELRFAPYDFGPEFCPPAG